MRSTSADAGRTKERDQTRENGGYEGGQDGETEVLADGWRRRGRGDGSDTIPRVERNVV
jgi:hypothetical protein